jgi:outer membrane immunogenic protein
MSRSMRCVIACLAVLGFAPQAPAADLGVLRGSDVYGPGEASYYDWSGFYFGGQVGYANVQADFGGGTSSLVANMLRNTTLEDEAHVSEWTVLGSADVRDVNYGGFVGYNSQWENVILGIEANYNRISASVSDSDSLRRIVSAGGDIYDVTVTSEAALRITDYGTLRGRAGWVLGRFLPYATLGFAMGRVEATRSASVIAFDAPTGAAYVPLYSTETKAVYAIGYAAGAGIDVAVLPNVFLRAEVEWLQFTNLPDEKANITTGRVAAGMKF